MIPRPTARALVAALACLVTGVVGAQGIDLPGLKVFVDDQPVDVGVVRGESNAFRVPMQATVAALTNQRATVKVNGRTTCSIVVEGVERVRFDLGFGSETVAKVLALGGGLVRKIDLEECPALVDGRLVLDVDSLSRVMGADAYIEGQTLSLHTPEYWARQIGIDQAQWRGLNVRSIGRGIVFGVTPPAQDMIAWVRPPAPAYAQLFKLTGGPARPLIAVGLDGKRRNSPGPNDLIVSVGCDSAKPARAITHHIGDVDGKVAAYAAAVTEKNVDGDPVAAINHGMAGDWTVVGMRQKVVPSPIGFRLVNVVTGKSVAEMAKAARMPLDLLREMNGLGQSSQPEVGESLIVIDSAYKAIPKGALAGDLYEVQPSETLDGLAKKWGVDPDIVLDLNPDLLPGQTLAPGQILVAPQASLPSNKKIEPVGDFAKTSGPAILHQTSDLTSPGVPLAAHEKVLLLNKVGSDLYQIRHGDDVGYLPASAIALDSGSSPGVGEGSVPARPATVEEAIRIEALKHLGARYVFGGGSLTNGIDCSHYVATVMERVGVPSPPPPVIRQEQSGSIVHWKVGMARYGPRPRLFDSPPPPLASLRPGDRIIIQWDPVTNDRSGGRHTGIFIGRYGPYIKYGVVNATRSRGVTVSDLVTSFLWKGYRFAVRDVPKRRGARAAAQ